MQSEAVDLKLTELALGDKALAEVLRDSAMLAEAVLGVKMRVEAVFAESVLLSAFDRKGVAALYMCKADRVADMVDMADWLYVGMLVGTYVEVC